MNTALVSAESMLNIAYTLKQMPKLIPDLESHVLAHCGHWLQCEQPEAVNRHLLDFLACHYPA